MVRLVFRPYTQVQRSICTSEPRRASIRVSSDFTLLTHSSPSFGYHRYRSDPTPNKMLMELAQFALSSHAVRSDQFHHFHCACEFSHSMTRANDRLLGPCFKTGRIDLVIFALIERIHRLTHNQRRVTFPQAEPPHRH